jgi:peptidoglycan hydrolase-like protein with peptidoglycan-binding domain
MARVRRRAQGVRMGVNLSQPIVGPLRVGIRNDAVRVVQERLNEVLSGTPGNVRLGTDGAFGDKTRAAVVRFQRARQLRADGVVGPITAKALGFTHYTSLQRIGAGAAQLASVIGGSLARLVPSAHSEPDPAYDVLMAMTVQADVMRQVVAGLTGATTARLELERIVAGLKRQLEGMRNQAFLVGAIHAFADALQMHNRLVALASQLQAIVRQQGARPGAAPERAVLEMLSMQTRLLAAQAAAFTGMQGMTMQRQVQAANEVLQIAARVASAARQMIPRF